MKMTITGYSTALFSTWYFIEELGLLLDAGDGLSAALLQKAGKIKHAFISHADRDHLTGLLQFNQLNAREKYPIVYYPKDSGSFPALGNFFDKFDPHVQRPNWIPLDNEQEIFIKNNIAVKCIRNEHVDVDNSIIKSLSFDIFEVKQKLKAEFHGLSGSAIKQLRQEKGNDFISETVRTPILSYSGDTPVHNVDRWKHSKILIHEATFLDAATRDSSNAPKHAHSTLEEVIAMVAESQVEHLILGHFSTRYSTEQIQNAILNLRDKYSLEIPISCVLPGQVVRDILYKNFNN